MTRGRGLLTVMLMALGALAAATGLAFVGPSAGASTAVRGAVGQTVAGDSVTRPDPAADRLRLITYGLGGAGVLLLLGTAVFWRVTRPPLLLAPTASPSVTPPSGGVARGAEARTGWDAPAAAKIPAAVVLAQPLTVPVISASPVVPAAAASAAGAAGAAGELAPPTGEPAIVAPAPLADIPFGAPQPLVGADSAWEIRGDSVSELAPASVVPEDFAPADAPAHEPVVASPAAVEPPVAAPPVAAPPVAAPPVAAPPVAAPPAAALISALAALPDKEPTHVRFDDPPVQRVPQRRAPAGAPEFDRIAKEITAQRAALVADEGARDPR